jgi:acyl-CoA synthetase (NDP forming)
MRIGMREEAMGEASLDRLLRPRSIAVIGASTREMSFGYRALNNLKTQGFGGPIYPVNPRYEEILGFKCYPSLAEVPETVDAAFVALAAERAPEALEECGRHGVGGAAVVASGFELQRRIVEIAARHGIALNGPNNLGAINLFDRAILWPSRLPPGIEAGPVALVTQSGSIGIATSQDERKLGLGYTITAGNEAALTVADYIDFLAGDARIKVIMLFLESIRRPQAFAAAVRKARAAGQTVLALKVGVSESGARAVQAHTGALAGEDAVYDAFFRAHGVLRVQGLDEMQETAALLSAYPERPGNANTVPVTLSGGQAALFADLAARAGVPGRDLSPETVAKLRQVLPSYANPRNPLDAFGAGWDAEMFDTIVGILTEDPEVGIVAFSMDAPGSGGADSSWVSLMADMVGTRLPRPDKRYIFVNNLSVGGLNPHVREKLDGYGVPYLLGMTAATAAIGNWLAMPDPLPLVRVPAKVAAKAHTDPERFALLSEAGVPMAECRIVDSAEAAAEAADSLGYPVVIKGGAEGLLHKSEAGAVRVGLADARAVRAAYDDVSAALTGRPGAVVYLQPQAGTGIELLLGLRVDPAFGPVVAVGLGGTLVEVMKEASLRLAPVSVEEAAAMLDETRAGELLAGVRGRGPFDVAAAAEAIAAFSRFGAALAGDLAALEVNPLIVLPRGQGAVGVDAAFEKREEKP